MTLRTRLAAMPACADLDELARVLFAEFGRDVEFSFGCFATTDPVSGVITRAFKTHPLPMGDEEFAAAEYGEPDLNLLAEIARRPAPVGVLSVDSGGDVSRCRRFRDYMVPAFGFTDELRLVLRRHGLVWGALAVYRGAGEQSFDETDATATVSAVDAAAGLVQRTLFAPSGATRVGDDAPAVVVVGGDDRARELTAGARRRIEDLGGWEAGSSLPASVLAVAATARHRAAYATSRACGRSGRWHRLRAGTVEPGPAPTTGVPRTDVVVTIDDASGAEVGRMALVARGLTAREREVTDLVLQGMSTAAIASSLFLSPHTVQDHLKSVFAKLGVTSRREMIATLVLS
jgi:DNA-binding CsgD family transcriptional regulator